MARHLSQAPPESTGAGSTVLSYASTALAGLAEDGLSVHGSHDEESIEEIGSHGEV